MVSLFMLVFCSSLIIGAISILYLIAEHLFQEFLQLNIKTRILKIIILLQPALILLTILVSLLLGTTPQKEHTGLYDSTANTVQGLPYIPIPDSKYSTSPSTEISGISSKIIPFISWLPNIAYLWMGIFILLLAKKMIVYVKFKKTLIQKGLRPIFSGDTPLTVYESQSISSPFLIGFFKPRIIVPDVDMDNLEFSFIIKHENAHYKNRDIQAKFILEVIGCLNWFNPIFSMIQKKFNYVAELNADSIVIENLSAVQRKRYGMLILKFAERLQKSKSNGSFPGFYSHFSEDAKNMKNRLEAIMKNNKAKKTSKLTIASIFALSILAISAGVYATSASYSNAMEIHTEAQLSISNKENPSEIPIYDDGMVQIFDGDESQNIPAELSHTIDPNDSPQEQELEYTGTENRKSFSEMQDMRKIVLQNKEYRSNEIFGESIYSLSNGTVISAEFEQGYGNCLTIQDEDGFIWKYAFCSKLLVGQGANIAMGDLIAYVGHSGFAEQDSILIQLFEK